LSRVKPKTVAKVAFLLSLVILLVSSFPCNSRLFLTFATSYGAADLGLSLDLYCQYENPYGGQGHNMPADSFAPQVQVELYALVTYNEDPLQQELVGFEARHGEFNFSREAVTDATGIAHFSFRIPWPSEDPAGRVLGEWAARATVNVAGKVANDTMPFMVWWSVEVTSIEPKTTYYLKRYSTCSDLLTFTMEFRTYHMQRVPVCSTLTVYDELGFFIASSSLSIEAFGWDEYGHYCTLFNSTFEIGIPMPSNAEVGKCTAFADAFDALPWASGTPYCPEKTNTIDCYIILP
jgi:hypothetical protein